MWDARSGWLAGSDWDWPRDGKVCGKRLQSLAAISSLFCVLRVGLGRKVGGGCA